MKNNVSTRHRRVEFVHNGFHGRRRVRFMAHSLATWSGRVEVSRAVAQRLNAAVCGCSGCKCYEGIAEMEGDPYLHTDRYFVLIPASGEARGNYPQQ